MVGIGIVIVKAWQSRTPADLPVAAPAASFPLPGSEDTMRQIASQEQAAQVMIAAASASMGPGQSKIGDRMGDLAQQLITGGGDLAVGRMPRVEVINDPQQIMAFERCLLGGDDE